MINGTTIWENPRPTERSPHRLSWKGARSAGSRTLRSVTTEIYSGDGTYVTRHLYLSDHGDRAGGVHVPRIRLFHNEKDMRTHRVLHSKSLDGIGDPLLAGMRLAPDDPELAPELATRATDALAEALPRHFLRYIPTNDLDGAQQLVAAVYPLFRHLVETQDTNVPRRVALRWNLFEVRTALDAVRAVVGPDGASRPAAAEVGRLLVVDGRVRYREMLMMVGVRGLSRDTIAAIMADAEPVGEGTALVQPEDADAAAQAMAGLGPVRHEQMVRQFLADPDGHTHLAGIGRAYRDGRLTTAGARTGQQLVERATRRGPFDDLDGVAVPGTGLRLHVVYPGDDAELVQLGRSMRNCIRHYARGRSIPFERGVIIALRDLQGRPQQAIQLTEDRRIMRWEGRGGTQPPPRERERITQTLRGHGVVDGGHPHGGFEDPPF